MIWVRTYKLKELEKTRIAPIDLTPFMATTGDGSAEPRMTESIRLIVADMISVCQKRQPELSGNLTVDAILLALAGQGLASLSKSMDDSSLWVASPGLIDCFEMGKDGKASLSNSRSKIQMYDALDTVTRCFYEMGKGRVEGKLSRRSAAITTLLTLEIGGEAIAYQDDQGRLAWKSSGDLRKSFE